MSEAIDATPLRRMLLFLVIVGASVALLVPGHALLWLRVRCALFDWYVLWNDRNSELVDFGHVILFAVLGWIASRALPTWSPRSIALSLVLFGAASEFLQMMIPGRHARVLDFVADVLCGGMAIWLSRSRCLPLGGRSR